MNVKRLHREKKILQAPMAVAASPPTITATVILCWLAYLGIIECIYEILIIKNVSL